jgi:hypothetical protein
VLEYAQKLYYRKLKIIQKVGIGYDDAFDQYVRTGGMPGAYVYKMEERQYDYIRIYDG